MATQREAIEAAQRALRAEFPMLDVDGRWGFQTQRAFDNASHPTRIEVIKVVADRGHSLNVIQDQGNKGMKAVRESAAKVVNRVTGTVSHTVRTAARLLSGQETRFLERCMSRGLDRTSALHLMAQVKAESGFRARSEDHRYSPDRARSIFAAAKGMSDAQLRQLVAGGPSVFFEAMYGVHTDAGRRLGNTERGDGGRYYGRGFLQITGRYNYSRCGAFVGIDLISDPDRLVSDWDVSADGAIWYWKAFVEARDLATNVREASRVVTGQRGYDVARREMYAQEYMNA